MDTRENAPGPDGATPGAPRPNFATVLRHASFRNLWLGQVVSQVGDYFAFLALLVITSGTAAGTADATGAVSGLLIAFTLPRLVFGVLAGVFVDRWDRRRTMLVSDLVRGVLVLALIPAFRTGNLAAVYALAFAISAFGTLFNPAKGALIPLLVPEAELTTANALSQASQMLAQFVGPALAGATFTLAGNSNQWVAFAIDAASFAVSAVALTRVRAPRPVQQQAAVGESALSRVWNELLIGLRALVLNRTMATLAVVFAVLSLGIGAINVLWVVYLRTQFGFTAADLAWRISVVDIAFAAGMLASSTLIGNLAARVAPKWLIVVGLLGAGLLTVAIAVVPEYWMLAVTMAGVGLFVGPINTGVTTLMQVAVPNSQLGRVGGGLGTATDTATLGSMSLAGVLGGLVGIAAVFAGAGLIVCVAGALAWALLPPLTLQDRVMEAAPERPGMLQRGEA